MPHFAGIVIAFIVFADRSIKLRAERYSSSITNLLEMVLKQNVRVRMGLIPDNRFDFESPLDSLTEQYMEKFEFLDYQGKMVPNGMRGSPYNNETVFLRKIRDAFEGNGHRNIEKFSGSLPSGSSSGSSDENDGSLASKEKGMEIAVLSTHTKASNKKKLENAWMQVADSGISEFPILSKNEKGLAIRHNGGNGQLFYDPSVAMDRPLELWEDEPNHETKALKLHDIKGHHKSEAGGDKINYAISPSLIHINSFGNNFSKENS